MRMQMLLVGVLMLCAAGSLPAQDAATLQIQLDQVKGERDALRAQLAQAQLRISQLESQVKQLQGGSVTPAVANSTGGEMSVTMRVTGVSTADVNDLREQLRQRQTELKAAEQTLKDAKSRLDRMERENEFFPKSRAHSSVALGSARADITKAENRVRGVRVHAKRLEDDIQQANSTQLVTGQDVLSGEVIKAVAAGPAAELAATLVPDKVYTVTGRKRTLNGVTELLIRTIKAE